MYDFSSMYPSQILSFNISPETFLEFTQIPKEEIPTDVLIKYKDDDIIQVYLHDDKV